MKIAKTCYFIQTNNNNNHHHHHPGCNSPLITKNYLPNSDLTSSFPQKEGNDHQVSLRVNMWPAHCVSSRYWHWWKLPLQINSYPNLSRYWVGTDHIHKQKVPSVTGYRTSASSCSTSSKYHGYVAETLLKSIVLLSISITGFRM